MNTREWGIRLCSSSQVNCAFLNDPWPTEDAEILSICGGREHTNSLEYLIFRSTMLRHLQSFLILNVNENVSGQMLVILSYNSHNSRAAIVMDHVSIFLFVAICAWRLINRCSLR